MRRDVADDEKVGLAEERGEEARHGREGSARAEMVGGGREGERTGVVRCCPGSPVTCCTCPCASKRGETTSRKIVALDILLFHPVA